MKDVLVCGYDDIPEIRNLLPPMASNRADPFELGYQAICIGHKKETGEHVLRSVFVLRESMLGKNDHKWRINNVLESFMEERTSHHPLRKDIEYFLKERHSKNQKELLSSISRLFENSYISQIDFYDFCELVPKHIQRKVTQMYQSHQFNNLQKQIEKNVKISELVTQVNQIDFNLLQNELQEIYLDLESNIDVFTLPGAQRYTGSEFEVPTKLKHSFSLHERLVRGGKEEVLLKDILNVYDSNSKIVLPAYYNENQYGLIISDYDYLDMDLFLLLANVISSKIHSTLLIKDLNRYASYDSLTGLLNYRGFMDNVKNIKEKVYLMIVDLNNLKKINDTYGHQFGNIAIIGVADMLKEVFGNSIIARFGGDEFIVVYKEEIGYESIILKTIDNYNNTHDLPFKTHFAFGETLWNPSKENLKEAIERADQAMYVRKKEMKKE